MAKGRRPHGTGSIAERSDGRFQGRYKINGKAYYVYADTYAACNKALLAAIKAEKKQASQPKRILIRDYMPQWLDSRLDYRANSRQRRLDVIQKYINPMLGDIEVAKLTGDQVRAFVAALVQAGLSPRTIDNIYSALQAACRHAVDIGLAEVSPCIKIKLPKIEKTEHTILDIEQAQRLCAETAGHWIEPIIKLGLATGMRKSELLALKWSDIDLVRGVITVRHNVAYVPDLGHVPGPPKTQSSQRTIALTSFGIETLKEHRLTQMATRDTWAKSDLVFPNAKGSYRIANNVNRVLDRMTGRANVPRVTFQELRHSAVSILLAMNVNIKIIQELCGHKNVATTLNLYGHLLPNAQGEAMKQYGDAWKQEDVKKDEEVDERWA